MSSNTEQRKLAAILFTDLVGYSAPSWRNEVLVLADVAWACCHELKRPDHEPDALR